MSGLKPRPTFRGLWSPGDGKSKCGSWLNGSSGVGDAGRMAGPSAALRSAQDDEFGVGSREQGRGGPNPNSFGTG